MSYKLFLSLSVVVLLARAAHAATMLPLDLRTLTQRADWVLVGTPTSSESYWDGLRIYTRHTVRVRQAWIGKLQPNDTIYVHTMGGIVDDIGQQVEGAPVLRAGKEYVFFLAQRADGEHRCIGMQQGVFDVDVDTAGNFIPRSTIDPGVLKLGPSPALPETLDALYKLILSYHHDP